jgi:two-component system NarL family response regulator
MNNYVPSLISNGERTLSPMLRDLDPPQTNGGLHAVPDDTVGIAKLAADPLPWNTLDVLVADPHPVVLAGLTALLASHDRVRVVGEARNGREAVDRFLATRPDVGIFEVRMPLLGGIEAVTAILREVPHARLVMFTNCQSAEDVYRAVRAGAQGYVFKNAPVEELIQSICAVAAGRQWIPSGVGAQLARRIVDRELTTRESEVLLGITSGKSNKEIGVALNISEATVKVHVTHILEKLKASGRTDAIRVAVQRGLVQLDVASAA